MKAELEEIMSQVTIDTLEKLAFMFAYMGEDEEAWAKDSMVAGAVSFTGHFTGTLVMTISVEVLQELTANMLGLDDAEDATENLRSDALKETMNVICGNVLPAVTGEEYIFDIGVPEVFSADQEITKGSGIPVGLDLSAKVILEFDEGQCVLSLFSDGKIPKDAVSAEVG